MSAKALSQEELKHRSTLRQTKVRMFGQDMVDKFDPIDDATRQAMKEANSPYEKINEEKAKKLGTLAGSWKMTSE
jgi:uncharacterized protein YnzC (UPF0291/DUF896 family)